MKHLTSAALVLVLVAGAAAAGAQPSGGPNANDHRPNHQGGHPGRPGQGGRQVGFGKDTGRVQHGVEAGIAGHGDEQGAYAHRGAAVVGGEPAMRPRDAGRAGFNPRTFPHVFHTTRRFHVAPYVHPRGWYSRAWAFGDFLPYGWYGSQYYLDWDLYGLPAPPIGCEWVRVGGDALLVDVSTGEVLSVYPGIFW